MSIKKKAKKVKKTKKKKLTKKQIEAAKKAAAAKRAAEKKRKERERKRKAALKAKRKREKKAREKFDKIRQENNSKGRYIIYMNYDNDQKVHRLPVNPEKIQVAYKGETSSVEIDRFGEVLHKNRRDAATIKFSSFLPANYQRQVCSVGEKWFEKPKDLHEWILKLMDSKEPCHFVVTGTPMSINLYAVVTGYTAEEVGGDPGTIQYTLELKEHREPKITTYKNKKKVSSGNRGGNKAKTKKYKVKAKKAWFRKKPNGKKIKKLKKGTKVLWDGKKKGKWYHVKYKKKWGYIHKSKLKKL